MEFFHHLNKSELMKEGPVAWEQNYFQGAVIYLGHGSWFNDDGNCMTPIRNNIIYIT
jgi:hypothetical protein